MAFMFIRIRSHNNTHIQKIIDFSCADAYIYCKETKVSNDHTHLLLRTPMEAKSMRIIIQKLGYKGNPQYSCKDLNLTDPEYKTLDGWPLNPIAYCVKTGEWFTSNIPVHVMDAAIKLDRKIKANLKQSISDKIIEFISQKYTKEFSTPTGCSLIREILWYHVENSRGIRPFQIEMYYHTISCDKKYNLYSKEYLYRLADNIFEKTNK